MKVLVVGGGYLGLKIADYLNRHSIEILLITSKVHEIPNELNSIKIYQHCWESKLINKSLFNNIDVVVYAAGMNADDCERDPYEAIRVNGLHPESFLRLACESKVGRFIYLSTAHVYANPLVGEFDEDSPLLNFHPYATSHHIAEMSIIRESQKKTIEGVILRLANVFGLPLGDPRSSSTLFVNDICKQAVINRKIEIKSSRNQRRNFISIDTFCECIHHFVKIASGSLAHNIFNVGSNWTPSLEEVANLVQSNCKVLFGYTPKLIFHDNNSIEHPPLHYVLDRLVESGFVPNNKENFEISKTLKVLFSYE